MLNEVKTVISVTKFVYVRVVSPAHLSVLSLFYYRVKKERYKELCTPICKRSGMLQKQI